MFKALSNPHRLRIFLELATNCVSGRCCEASVAGMRRCAGDLGADLGLAASTVSHHLKELRRAGLMHVERRGQKIECWISDDTLRLLATFFTDAGAETAGAEAAGADIAAADTAGAEAGGTVTSSAVTGRAETHAS